MSDLQQESFWEESWLRHMESYLGAPPRCGNWLRYKFGETAAPVLEIAGGSCRDSRYLAETGIEATGTDFDQKTLQYLQQKFPYSTLALQHANAFELPFADNSFQLSFSNGFWVCFADDSKLHALAHEQVRVTRKWMIIVVHNARNQKLRDEFAHKANTDSLYDIRFFDPDDLLNLVESFKLGHRKIRIAKFGGIFDKFYIKKIKGLPNPFLKLSPVLVPWLYSYQSWKFTERVACIVELS